MHSSQLGSFNNPISAQQQPRNRELDAAIEIRAKKGDVMSAARGREFLATL
jgi:hypothetical protein